MLALRDLVLLFGPLRVSPAAMLAPMASISNPPFRTICLALGCGLATTEMVAAHRLARGGRQAREKAFTRAQGEKILHVQIFGNDPGVLAEGARVAEGRGADALDVNLGCPARKVVSSGSGAALGRDATVAARAVEAVVAAVKIPVSAKIRSGWDGDHINAVDAARRIEAAGAAMITVHPRTRAQQFSGRADWSVIRDVATSVRIPVVGNGDVRRAADAERMIAETGCAAVMVGRGAFGRPWVFRALATGADDEPDAAERVAILSDHVRRYADWAGEEKACRELRKHLLWFVRRVPGAAAFRAEAQKVATRADVDALLGRAVELLG